MILPAFMENIERLQIATTGLRHLHRMMFCPSGLRLKDGCLSHKHRYVATSTPYAIRVSALDACLCLKLVPPVMHAAFQGTCMIMYSVKSQFCLQHLLLLSNGRLQVQSQGPGSTIHSCNSCLMISVAFMLSRPAWIPVGIRGFLVMS